MGGDDCGEKVVTSEELVIHDIPTDMVPAIHMYDNKVEILSSSVEGLRLVMVRVGPSSDLALDDSTVSVLCTEVSGDELGVLSDVDGASDVQRLQKAVANMLGLASADEIKLLDSGSGRILSK